MLRQIVRNKRVWLTILAGVAAIIAARLLIPADAGFRLVIKGGYWFMLAAVVLFCAGFGRVAVAKIRELRLERFHLLIGVIVLMVSVIWAAQERPGFKILADEVLLLGTSMGMHYERDASYPVRATDVQGPFQILASVLDKRPLLFPFLTAMVHDLTGYRPENPFYLNMVLGAVFLTAVYAFGCMVGGRREAGVLTLVLFAGLPLLAQQATGGGFELLNLLLIVLLGLAAGWYLEKPDETKVQAVVYTAVLLACTRYESVLFLLPAALVVLLGWIRNDRVIAPWPVIIAPVFLVPVLLQNRIFSGQSGAWEMQSMPGVTSPFSLEYVIPNIGHALAFFFDLGPYQPSSPLFALFGLIALPFFFLLVIRILRAPKSHSSGQLAGAILGVGLFLVSLVYLFYFWGQFDHPVIRRLSLPVHLLMAVAIVAVASLIKAWQGIWKTLTVMAIAGALFHGLPVMAKRAYAYGYSPSVEMEIRREFLKRLPERDFLFLDNDSVFWITHKVPATPIAQARLRKDGLAYHLRNHSFSQIYIFQSVLVEDDTGEQRLDPDDDLGSDFELETIWTRRVQALLFARISRVTAIREGSEVVARATEHVPAEVETLSPEEVQKARALYLENWIKMLP